MSNVRSEYHDVCTRHGNGEVCILIRANQDERWCLYTVAYHRQRLDVCGQLPASD